MKYLRRKRETIYKKSRKYRRNNRTKKIKGGFGFLQVGLAVSFGYLSSVPTGLNNNSLIAVTDSSGKRPPTLPQNDKLIVIKDPKNPNKIEEFDAHGFTGTTMEDFLFNLKEKTNLEDQKVEWIKTPFDPKTPDEVSRKINENFVLQPIPK